MDFMGVPVSLLDFMGVSMDFHGVFGFGLGQLLCWQVLCQFPRGRWGLAVHLERDTLPKTNECPLKMDGWSRCTLPPIIMVQWKIAYLETKHIFQDPIFHFHDYGRKCISY